MPESVDVDASRCHALLRECQDDQRFLPADMARLRLVIPLVVVWPASSDGSLAPVARCNCSACGGSLTRHGIKTPLGLGLGKSCLFHVLLPLATCGRCKRRRLTFAMEEAMRPPDEFQTRLHFDIFAGRVVEGQLTDWLCRTFRKHFNQQALRASYLDLLGTAIDPAVLFAGSLAVSGWSLLWMGLRRLYKRRVHMR
ncbi:unnamed protein product [Effrenium voratum]|nr:unnamed protein product [Effrenium voratum]